MTAQVDPMHAEILAALREYSARTDPNAIDHTVQVTSFGGSGTTALCAHLIAAGVDLQKGPGQWPFKHRRTPPRAESVPDGFRVVYLVGDPRDAVLSVFRRGYQYGHYRGLNEREPGAEADRRLVTLEHYLHAGIDDFELADHLERWRNHEPGYPVLFARYEYLTDAWGLLADFIGLDPDTPALELRERESDWESLPPSQRDEIDEMYGDLARRIEELPPADIL